MNPKNETQTTGTPENANTKKKEWTAPQLVDLAVKATKNQPGGGPDGFKFGTSHS